MITTTPEVKYPITATVAVTMVSTRPCSCTLPAGANLTLLVVSVRHSFLRPKNFNSTLNGSIDQLQTVIPAIRHLRGTFHRQN